MPLPKNPEDKAYQLHEDARNWTFDQERDENDAAKDCMMSVIGEIINALEEATTLHNFYWEEVKHCALKITGRK